jgi:hypothetical protein
MYLGKQESAVLAIHSQLRKLRPREKLNIIQVVISKARTRTQPPDLPHCSALAVLPTDPPHARGLTHLSLLSFLKITKKSKYY